MDRRTKILAGVLGGCVLLGFVDRVIWPRWIGPILSIDDRIAERQAKLDTLRADQEAVDNAKEEYKALVGRVGSFEPSQVQTAMLDRIGSLIEKNKLENVSVTPARPKLDNKTGLARMVVTVKAVATLPSVVNFLRDLAELPQIARIGNSAITPSSQRRRGRGKPKMTLRVPIEVLVIPQQKVVGNIDLNTIEHPTSKIRHTERNYSKIWELKPFSQYVPPVPLKALAGPAHRGAPTKQKLKSRGGASGGEPPYSCEWEPADRLSDPNVCAPTIDISEEFEQVFTLRVVDAAGNKASARKNVMVAKKKPPPQPPIIEERVPTIAVKRPDPRWKDGKHMQLRMALLASSKAGDTDEVAVFNKRAKRMTYYGLGDEFDGGKLVYVHPTGAVARRNDAYFIYPIGRTATEDVPVTEADELFGLDYPRLVQMADWMTRRDAAAVAAKAEAEAKAKADANAKARADAAARKATKAGNQKGATAKKPAGPAKAKPEPALKGAAKKNPAGKPGGAKNRRARKPQKEYPPLPADEAERIEKEYAANQKAKQAGGSANGKKAKNDKGTKKKPE